MGNIEELVDVRYGSTCYILYMIEPIPHESLDATDFKSTPLNSEMKRHQNVFWTMPPKGWIEAHRVCKGCKTRWDLGSKEFGERKPNKRGMGGLS